MTISLETFVKQLQDSGIIDPGKLQVYVPPQANPKSTEELIQQLVSQKQLTKFQAKRIAAGRGKTLILGSYTLLDEIGAGGMGQVYKAEQRRMHRIVALKMLPKNMRKDAAAIARFEREETAAAKLRHPNIVATDDAAEANGVQFLVMEFVDGQDLAALVKASGPLSVERAVQYVLQAAHGLAYAHGEGVIHRDIKPSNLLLDKKGTVKILDLGLARIDNWSETTTQTEITSTGAVMGTVDYLAPEQAADTKHADGRADIYSLGCTLYYLIKGTPLYDGDSVVSKLLAHREQPIPSLSTLHSEVTPELEAIFQKMIAKKVEDRYQSMTEVVTALEHVSGHGMLTQPIDPSYAAEATGTLPANVTASLKPGTPAAIVRTPTRRKSPALIFGAAAFLALIAGGAVWRWSVKPQPEVKPPSSPPQKVAASNATNPSPSKSEKFGNSPEFQTWMKSVQALPAAEQITAVSKKLVELNPGYDGNLWGIKEINPPRIENGNVVSLEILSDVVTDITPVRALTGLKELTVGLGASGKKTPFADLAPLAGLRLTRLYIAHTRVSDLSPLKQMPLDFLNCGGTPVADLAPLENMPLRTLIVYNTNVADLSPLRNMPLSYLQCKNTVVADLQALETCSRLRSLKINSTKVTPQGVAALQAKLPSCLIEWDDPAKAISADR